MNKIPNIPEMTTLVECMQALKKEGYSHEFDVKGKHLICPDIKETYSPEDIVIDNFYRFEGESSPADSAILYAISTHDGKKGTLVDAYGTYSDEDTDLFMKKVQDITKIIRQ